MKKFLVVLLLLIPLLLFSQKTNDGTMQLSNKIQSCEFNSEGIIVDCVDIKENHLVLVTEEFVLITDTKGIYYELFYINERTIQDEIPIYLAINVFYNYYIADHSKFLMVITENRTNKEKTIMYYYYK